MTTGHAHVGRYLTVFGALMILTGITVGVSLLHMGIIAAVGVAMIVAGMKGALVAAYFMHLINEHKWVYLVLIITAFLFLFLLFVPLIVSQTDYQLGR